MDAFRPFEMKGRSPDEQIRSWGELNVMPFDKRTVDAYTRCRVILMNGIENNAVLTSHALARMVDDDDVRRLLAQIRRVDSQHQLLMNWLNPADQTVLETTIAYEQVAVDLTSNLARNESDPNLKQALDFALLEDFDHLFRYGCLLELYEGMDPNQITQGYTEIKPGRPTVEEHRHPDDTQRRFYDKDSASLRTKMDYYTIVSGEQQTMLFYRAHGFQYDDPLMRGLYQEIAEIEEEHVSQYEACGDPHQTPLETLAMVQLNQAFNFFSCAQTETDERIRSLWWQMCEDEIGHINAVDQMLKKKEGRSLQEVMRDDTIEPLIVFESNKEYVNQVLADQLDLQASGKEFVRVSELPEDWPSFDYMNRVNAGSVPSEQVTREAEDRNRVPAPDRRAGMHAPAQTIYDRLHADHIELQAMFAQLETGYGDGAELFARIRQELTAHSRAEEEVFYRPLLEQARKRQTVLKGYEEHSIADWLSERIAVEVSSESDWKAGARVLAEVVQHHVTDEEGSAFQVARMTLDERTAEQMAGSFDQAKQRHMQERGRMAA